MSTWAMLRAREDGRWDVTGGAVRREFFFEGARKKDLVAYTDPTKWRFVLCGDGVRVGAVVTLSADGSTVIWPPEKSAARASPRDTEGRP